MLCVLLQGNYFEAAAVDVDHDKRLIRCKFPKEFKGGPEDSTQEFTVPYDVLVFAVGHGARTCACGALVGNEAASGAFGPWVCRSQHGVTHELMGPASRAHAAASNSNAADEVRASPVRPFSHAQSLSVCHTHHEQQCSALRW